MRKKSLFHESMCMSSEWIFLHINLGHSQNHLKKFDEISPNFFTKKRSKMKKKIKSYIYNYI